MELGLIRYDIDTGIVLEDCVTAGMGEPEQPRPRLHEQDGEKTMIQVRAKLMVQVRRRANGVIDLRKGLKHKEQEIQRI